MKQAVAGRPVIDFPVPEGVTFAQIDRSTGLRAAAGREAELEVFVKGSEPAEEAAAPEEAPTNPESEQDGVPEGD
jgi:membrane carboxypeptidase/penicillin-binding protein